MTSVEQGSAENQLSKSTREFIQGRSHTNVTGVEYSSAGAVFREFTQERSRIAVTNVEQDLDREVVSEITR